VLDPAKLSNVHFQHIKIKRGPGTAFAALGGSGLIKGRLQNMVPPQEMASPTIVGVSPVPVSVAVAPR
jgi:hypothetical protein